MLDDQGNKVDPGPRRQPGPYLTKRFEPDPTFPRIFAETQRFSLGLPRSFLPMADGVTVLFLCSTSPTDDVLRLWRWSLIENQISLLVDPLSLQVPAQGSDSDVEAERRERMRERAHGITAFSSDPHGPDVVFCVNGEAFIVNYLSGAVKQISAPGYVIDPRISNGEIIAVVDKSLWLIGDNSQVLLQSCSEDETFGLPDYLAAEEFSRHRGFWWSPKGDQLLVQQVDNSSVDTWWIQPSDDPSEKPRPFKYPAAGRTNPKSRLVLVKTTGGSTEIDWRNDQYPYLTRVDWSESRGLLITLLDREQKELVVQSVSPALGHVKTLLTQRDEHWVEVISGSPTWAPLGLGDVVTTVDDIGANTRRLAIDNKPISPGEFIINSIVDVTDTGAVVTGFLDPTTQQVAKVNWLGELEMLSDAEGWSVASAGHGVVTVVQATPATEGLIVSALWGDGNACTLDLSAISKSEVGKQAKQTDNRQISVKRPRAAQSFEIVSGSPDPTFIVWPSGFTRGSGHLPIVLAPYGGPHGRRAINGSMRAFAADQWLADHGFAVLIIDGPGTPGRGPKIEKLVAGDLCHPTVNGQVAGLEFVLKQYEESLDPNRVGIHGWSFGGYLAAAALLFRPDVFKAAIAGAPVTDWALYDSAYSERYLGLPTGPTAPNYQLTSLINASEKLVRPLLLIHGLADDNVVFAHTLQLSKALLESGKQHQVLPLSGVTHMASAVAVAENLERLQADFFVEHLQRDG